LHLAQARSVRERFVRRLVSGRGLALAIDVAPPRVIATKPPYPVPTALDTANWHSRVVR